MKIGDLIKWESVKNDRHENWDKIRSKRWEEK